MFRHTFLLALVLGVSACGGGSGSDPTPTPEPPEVSDTTPDAFTLVDQEGVEPGTEVISEAIIVAGIDAASPISITGGEYAINQQAFTDGSAQVNNGDEVRIRLVSSDTESETTEAVLTIGGVSDTFSVTVRDPILASGALPANPDDFFTRTVVDDDPTMFNCIAGVTAGVNVCTQELQTMLNEASVEDEDGGVVRIIQDDRYRLGRIQFPSNVRLEIDADTVIQVNNNRLFDFGARNNTSGTDPLVENIEITTTDDTGSFTINAAEVAIGFDVRPVRMGFVHNFRFANANILTNFAPFPTIFLGADVNRNAPPVIDGEFNPAYDRIPRNGVIENVSGENIATGFALVQTFGANTVLMRNLSATRGVTVRLEVGSGQNVRPLNPDGTPMGGDISNLSGPRFTAINNTRLENLTNVGGFTTLFIRSHAKINEDNTFLNLTGINTSFVLFVNSGEAPRPSEPNLTEEQEALLVSVPFYNRGYFTSLKGYGTLRHEVTDPDFLSDTTFAGHYFLPLRVRQGPSVLNSQFVRGFNTLPRDASGSRRLGVPSAPVLLFSEDSANDLGNDIPQGGSEVLNPPTLSSEPDLDELSGENENLLLDFRGRFPTDLSEMTFELIGLDPLSIGPNGVSADFPVLYRLEARDGDGSQLPSGFLLNFLND